MIKERIRGIIREFAHWVLWKTEKHYDFPHSSTFLKVRGEDDNNPSS